MTDILDGVLDVVDTEEHVAPQPKPVKTEKVETKVEAPKEEPKTETNTETKTEEVAPSAPADDEVEDQQDFSRPSSDDSETETVETTETEPSQTETKTETKPEAVDEWKPNLPPPPEFKLPEPQFDAAGYITNMTPQQYQQYVVEKAKHEFRQEAYTQNVENQALDAAENVLPEMKTNPAVRTMVENARIASILSGNQINSFEAAKLVKDALGLTNVEQKIAQARVEGKAEGVKNTKTSITLQKNAAVETQGSTKKKTENPQNNLLSKRLKMGDKEAFVDLMDQWNKDGKLS